MNHIDFTVPCAHYVGQKGFFRVYYVMLDGKQIPLPVDICDNGSACEACLKCAASVFKLAQRDEPPFPK